MAANENPRSWCNTCRGQTNHVVLEKQSRSSEPGEDIQWISVYEMLSCRGCDSISFRIRSSDSETIEQDENGQLHHPESVQYYPPAISREQPLWSPELPFEIYNLMTEIYAALHANSRTLAAMGIRAIIERVIILELKRDVRFEEGMKELVKASFMTETQRSILGAALELGHAVNHRGHFASPQQVNTAMDIVENMLQNHYVLKPEAEHLMLRIPQRQSSKGKKNKAGNAP